MTPRTHQDGTKRFSIYIIVVFEENRSQMAWESLEGDWPGFPLWLGGWVFMQEEAHESPPLDAKGWAPVFLISLSRCGGLGEEGRVRLKSCH
jgi:hypothetical protein